MNVRIAQLFCFNAGIWYDNELEMNQFTVKLWLITQTTNPEEQNIAFRRAKHFIHGELENTIFVNVANEQKCLELMQAGLNVTTLPNEPVEQLIGIMLFHKLNAVMEERIKLFEIEISGGDALVYLHGDEEISSNLAPADWWDTPDLKHCDYVLADAENVLSIAQNTAWRDLDLAWPEQPTDDNSGNVVVFADFKAHDKTE